MNNYIKNVIICFRCYVYLDSCYLISKIGHAIETGSRLAYFGMREDATNIS